MADGNSERPETGNDSNLSDASPASAASLIFYLACFLVALAWMSRSAADPDLWGHIQFGADTLDHGLQRTTTYSYTAVGYPWINHENLSEIILAATHRSFGNIGLSLGKMSLSCLVLALMTWNARRQGATFAVCGVSLFAIAIPLSFHWTFRPQVATFGCLLLLALVLDIAWPSYKGRRDRVGYGTTGKFQWLQRLMLASFLAALFFIWANSHGGFVAGLAIFVVFAVGRALEALLIERRGGQQEAAFALFAVIISGAVTLVNPYGWGLHRWLLQSLGTPRPEIADWHPVDWSHPHGVFFGLILLLTIASLALTPRRYDWTKVAVLLLVGWQASEHMRHVALFLVLFGCWVIAPLQKFVRSAYQSIRGRLGRRDLLIRVRWPLTAAKIGIGIASLSIAALATPIIWANSARITVNRTHFPVDAMQFMIDENIVGRTVVTYNWAQYVIAALGTRNETTGGTSVSFDGRFRTCYPVDIIDMNLDFQIGEASSDRRNRSRLKPFDPAAVLEHQDPELIVLDRRQRAPVAVMQSRRDVWSLLYEDPIAQVWGRSSVFDDPFNRQFVDPSKRKLRQTMLSGTSPFPAIPEGT